MRFTEHGPIIPDALLAAQERGDVLFMCGAGVSMPAGLPSFLRLAKLTADALSVPQNDPTRLMVQHALGGAALTLPLDLVFEKFQDAYGERQVEAKVAKLIRPAAGVDLSSHQTILKLSRDGKGRPRVLTTNFDPLFERAHKRLKTHIAPLLPRSDCQALEGAVYLHGRAGGQGNGPFNLVLSSRDFGRAYMAQGWATEFMREALARFTLVLVGYSADDPPINYLLRGMRNQGGQPIYAFAEDTGPDVHARWRERNVTALPYAPADATHRGLWDSLHAWADAATDPEAWRGSVLARAKSGPRVLKPHERGQMAAMIGTELGARALAASAADIPAEWIYVFDHAIRRAEAGVLGRDAETKFDPRPFYGLDDDPPECLKRDARHVFRDDVMAAQPSDGAIGVPARLSGGWSDRAAALPMRLHHLAGWIATHWASAHVLWWAAGRGTFHPELLSRIEHARRTDKSESKLERQIWTLIEEASAFPDDELTRDWWTLQARIEREGWTPSVLRAFAHVIRPKVTMRRPYWRDFAEAPKRTSDLANFEIAWFKRIEQLPRLTDDVRAGIVAELREALRIGASLQADIDPHPRTPSLYPHKGPGEPVIGRDGAFFLYFAKQFEALAKVNAAAAIREWQAWPHDEPMFFDKLRMWVWADANLAAAANVAQDLATLSKSSFWSRSAQKELLWALRARWAELSVGDRAQIEARILAGRDKLSREDGAQHQTQIAKDAVERLKWLQDNGCELSPETLTRLAVLIAELGEEEVRHLGGADYTSVSYGGWVATVEDTHDVIDLPISEIIPRCRQLEGERDFTKLEHHDPFQGLTKQKPLLALRALSLAQKADEYPISYWSDLLRHWPATASPRATWLLAQRLTALPGEAIVALHSATAEWLQAHHEKLDAYRKQAALDLYDVLFAAFAGGGDKTDSSVLSNADDTFDSAFNAPVGRLTHALLVLLNALKLKPGATMPPDFAERLEASLGVPAPGGAHAAAFLGADFHWLATITPAWVEAHLLPRFDLTHPHAVAIWDGLFWSGRPPQARWFAKLKPSFLAALKNADIWEGREGARRLGQLLANAVLVSTSKHLLMTPAEARAALQTTTEDVRDAALDLLQQFVAKPNGWRRYGARFLNEVWPLELALQTQRSARAWLEIAVENKSAFPEIARALTASSALVVVDELDIFAWTMRGEAKHEALAKLYPEAALDLLNAVVGARRPYEMDEVLNMIAEAAPHLRQDPRWLRLRLGKVA